MRTDEFFGYACKREVARRRKELLGFQKPWSDDPILQSYRFCNVFREDDKVTRWVKANIRDVYAGPRLLIALVAARWINRIETLERVVDIFGEWDEAEFIRRLEGKAPWVGAAYMVRTITGVDKLHGLAIMISRFAQEAGWIYKVLVKPGRTLEESVKLLADQPNLGPFLAYEVVCDLYHTPVLGNAPDIMTWANPGPGAARGIGRLLGNGKDHYSRHSRAHVGEMVEHMRTLLELSLDTTNWPSDWGRWDMRTVEHTLCEFDKYERAREGSGRPKQLYNGRD